MNHVARRLASRCAFPEVTCHFRGIGSAPMARRVYCGSCYGETELEVRCSSTLASVWVFSVRASVRVALDACVFRSRHFSERV